MDISSHRHDAFFKSYFGKTETLSELVKVSFPPAVTRLLDFSTLTIEPGTYIEPSLQPHFSDLAASVLSINGAVKIYVLVEHKSYHDPLALLQILRYMVRVWSKEEKPPLTPILPLLFYHGENKEVSSEFHSLFEPSISEPLMLYQPVFLTQIINLAAMNPMEFEASVKVVAAAVAMKSITRGLRFLVELLSAFLEKYGKDFLSDPDFVMIKTYLGSIELQGDETLEQTLEELVQNDSTKEAAMTLAEHYVKIGRQEGRQEGRLEEKFELARRLKAKSMPASEFADLTGLSINDIGKL